MLQIYTHADYCLVAVCYFFCFISGGHAWSTDGITWSNISGSNGEYALDGCFNLSRPFKAANGSILNVDYYTERPKLLLDANGAPTVLYGTVYQTVGNATRGFTIAEPLGPDHA
jgi:hypothetical protein